MWLLSSWDGERENRYKCVQRTRFLMTNIKGVCTRYPLLTTVSLAVARMLHCPVFSRKLIRRFWTVCCCCDSGEKRRSLAVRSQPSNHGNGTINFGKWFSIFLFFDRNGRHKLKKKTTKWALSSLTGLMSFSFSANVFTAQQQREQRGSRGTDK